MRHPRTHIFFIIFIFVFSLIACQKLFVPAFYTSHDGEGHVIRMIEYDEAWRDGQIPVRITKRINYGLGYPFFNFNYPLPYFVGQMFHLTGFSFVDSFKLLFVVSTFFGGVSMYALMLPWVGAAPAFVSALFYIFVPYRFLNMYVRGNPAESLALSLLPFFLWSADRFVRTKGKKYGLFILAGILFTLSHNSTMVLGTPAVLLFSFIRIYFSPERMMILKKFLFSFFIIILATSFFWLPVLVESGNTKLAELSEDYVFFFPTLGEVLYSPWGFGAYKQGAMPGKMSPQIGLLHIGAFLLGVITLAILSVKKKIVLKKDLFWIYAIFIVLIALFFMLPISKIVWDYSPLSQTVQIPWRFLGILTLGCSIVAGFALASIKISRVLLIAGILVTIGALMYVNRNHIRVNQYRDFTSPFERRPTYGFSTTSKDEHMPRLARRIHEDPNPDGDLISSVSGSSKRTVWQSNYQEFQIQADRPLEFRANVSYVPGWSASIDGNATPILYNKDEYQRLRIDVPSGIHTVVFRFGEPWYRLLVDLVSGITLVSLVLLCMIKKGKNI